MFIGTFFAIIGGIAPLIPPNELMPGYIRPGHGFEVGVSNFLYGLALGYLLGQRVKDPANQATQKTRSNTLASSKESVTLE